MLMFEDLWGDGCGRMTGEVDDLRLHDILEMYHLY